AFDAAGAVQDGRDAVRRREAEVVMTVHTDQGALDVANVLADRRDQRAELVGERVARRVGDVDHAGASVDYRLERFEEVLEVGGGGEGETGLDHIDTQSGELPGDRHLLIRRQRCAGRLLAVTQGRIEDENAVARGMRYGGLHQLLAFLSAFSQGIMARSSEPTFSISS